MIQFDLHIHSIASQYKEDKEIVENSTVGGKLRQNVAFKGQ